MGYYDNAAPPVRDQRLIIGDSFSGTGCEALDCAKSGCMFQKGRRFWQANMCQMSLSLMMAATVDNCVIVMHAPIGCGSTLFQLGPGVAKGKARRGKALSAPVWLSTNLTESDVIGGGERKLKETILYADREFHPEIIFVVATCAPNIIGDDVDDAVREAGAGAEAIVTAIHCPGFKSRVVASAYDAFYHSLLSRVPLEPAEYRDYTPIERADPDYAAKTRRFNAEKQYTVNIFNATSIGADDEEEMARLLGAIGLKTRIFAEYCSAAELRMVAFAGLNVSLCNVHDDYMLSYLQEKYNIPYIIRGMPIGFSATREWLIDIAENYGLADKARSLIEAEERQARAAIEPFLPELRGKRVVICGGVIRTGVEALFLKELGLDVAGVRAYHYDNGADPVLHELADELPDVPLAVSNQPFELVNQLRALRPDVVISHNGTHGHIARAGFVSVPLWDTDKPFFGYAGAFRFVRRLAFALKNTSYPGRLSNHVRLPYKPDWYEKRYDHYITE
ncbi:MAG: nitrogenase component 1 [Oscillospiraceae bacterium]|jgi:nitrogenase molybdenum-iron protein alpha chain|nr:nitrogenase component 1 [Oscillospiraceae bacterium]